MEWRPVTLPRNIFLDASPRFETEGPKASIMAINLHNPEP